jgi:membrane protease YdiL (CAAX protease family)
MQPLLDVAFLIVPTVPVATVAWLRRPNTWHFLDTTVFGLIALFVGSLVSYATFVVMLDIPSLRQAASPELLRAQMTEGGWMALAVIVSSPFTIAVLFGAVRIARRDFADYLALRWPSARELVRALAMMAVLLLVWFLIAYLTGHPAARFAVDGYRIVKASGWLPVYLIALCVAAPITEEFLVRGFLFRGWSNSFLGPAGAILLGSAVWALMHTQYDLFDQTAVFTSGLLLGYLRHRSGSTWLTVVVHAATNLVGAIEVAAFVAYYG